MAVDARNMPMSTNAGRRTNWLAPPFSTCTGLRSSIILDIHVNVKGRAHDILHVLLHTPRLRKRSPQRVLLVADEIATTICGQGDRFQMALSPIPWLR